MAIKLIKRFMVVVLLVGVVVFAGSLTRPAKISAYVPAQGDGPNRAGLVVRFSDDHVVTKCVTFDEDSIDGEDLLQRSGLNVGFGDDGALCSIENAGCPASDCFCECPFPQCEYWAFYTWQNGAWQYSNIGAVWAEVRNGTLHGWSWGSGDFVSGVEPPAISFEQVCGSSAAATPTAAATVPVAPAVTPPVTPSQPAPPSVPEPLTFMLFGGGVAGLAAYVVRRQRR